ncbi:ATP-binding cassette domain-containing protein [Paenalkalicoccus suaedae]|uniref:ATP-binding cassette domain-containing protein n=1 Tax=Paenalkalicoccus suaedae TaxID=2592382 RepID=A0A859FG38_9BACI|nr:ATP-binding cassette domain-containing protein [Paenalkalicoccus suaedae]QKS71196.1 ATP-binding cassette domain-containing protein [Paenalkalicoccus suaedae]
MIQLDHVTKKYGDKNDIVAVDDVSLRIEKGSICGIVGYSGAGKSTLLRCLNYLEVPSSGEVSIDGVELHTLSKSELRKTRQSIGMIFQHFNLPSSRSVSQIVNFALKASGYEKKLRKQRIRELLALVGLADKENAYPSQLSGGQKQRVSIARALANDPSILLCDEATSALDPKTTQSILALLKELNQKLQLTIVLITHEVEVVKEICDTCVIMERGQIIESGNTYDVFANPKEELTASFIDTVLHFSLPEKLVNELTGHVIKLTFRGHLASEAIVSTMLQTFKVKGNILHGKVEYIQDKPLGVFIMELQGDAHEIRRAVTYLENQVSKTEVIANGLDSTAFARA